jgi:uncharacterized protein (TIGR02246 family)
MSRFHSLGLLCISLLAIAFSSGCRRHHLDQELINHQRVSFMRITDAKESIRSATIDWSNASKARDLDKSVSFYADDAIQLTDKGPALQGKENIRKSWQDMLALPGPGLTFAATDVQVANAADLAWEYGTYDFATADKDGKVTDVKGKYVVVWKKQFDGSWKVVADIDNANQ